jgi:hypothetical protein
MSRSDLLAEVTSGYGHQAKEEQVLYAIAAVPLSPIMAVCDTVKWLFGR